MLPGSVDSGERLLVEYRLQTVPEGDTPESRHDEHVVVHGEIGLLAVGGHLELAGRDFVVSVVNWHSELIQLELRFGNAALNPLRNPAEVVILELLPARRRCTDECTAAHHQIRTHREVSAIDEEV